MTRLSNRDICNPSIEQIQAKCPHLHSTIYGAYHFSAGEVWDDIKELCDECGASLDSFAEVRRKLIQNQTARSKENSCEN
jgi:hypothetical protein